MSRADELLFLRGLVESRTKARALIEEGKVFVDGKLIDKPSRKLPDDANISIADNCASTRFVSRAGLKLEAFLDAFNIDLTNAHILDAGASTGGFTDCALSRGATLAYCVDVGIGQLHKKLLDDLRVKNFEKTDIRDVSPAFLEHPPFDFICADLSFISLEKVFGILWNCLKINGEIVCLVKPQFETDPAIMRRNKGVIRDDSTRTQALDKIKNFISENFSTAKFIGEIQSPIKGGDGNIEYLIGYKKI